MGHGREALNFCWDRWWMGNALDDLRACERNASGHEERSSSKRNRDSWVDCSFLLVPISPPLKADSADRGDGCILLTKSSCMGYDPGSTILQPQDSPTTRYDIY